MQISNDPARYRTHKVGVIIEVCKREPNSLRVLFPEPSKPVQSFEVTCLCYADQADLESRFAEAFSLAFPYSGAWASAKPPSRFLLVK